jgi:hypothetical protein
MAQRPESQAFWELKQFYSWLGDDQLALLQAVYQTWRNLRKQVQEIYCKCCQAFLARLNHPG